MSVGINANEEVYREFEQSVRSTHIKGCFNESTLCELFVLLIFCNMIIKFVIEFHILISIDWEEHDCEQSRNDY